MLVYMYLTELYGRPPDVWDCGRASARRGHRSADGHVIVGDDVAVNVLGRRGLAGTLFVHKVQPLYIRSRLTIYIYIYIYMYVCMCVCVRVAERS